MSFAGSSSAAVASSGLLSRILALAAAVTVVASTAGNLVRQKVLRAAITAAVSGSGVFRRRRKFSGASRGQATTAAALSLSRAQNVVVDFTAEDVAVSEVSMADVGLLPEYFRSNESRALNHRLIYNGSPVDMSTWTIELWWNGSAQKSITTVSSAATQGKIQNQGTNLGQYFFTILAADLVALLGSNSTITVPMRVRFVTPDTAPPRVFSNVVFAAVITAP
jgi:hypothetical protein